MPRSRSLARWTVHLAVFVLLLQAAVPLLAFVAAQAQGKGVAEICDVYGVALPSQLAHADHAAHAQHAGHGSAVADSAHALHHVHPAGHGGHHGEPGSDSRHRGDHCVLTALSALAAPPCLEAIDIVVADGSLAYAHAADERREPAPDASARWAALLRHAPPDSA